MIDITTESDIERLRQVALLMAAEIDQLHKRLAELTAELAEARGTDRAAALEAELRKLQSQLAERSRMLFGPRSERRPGEEKKPPRKPQKGHGPTPQPKLEERTVEHTFEGEDTKCTRCGGELKPMAWSDDSEEIDVIRRKFVVTRHKRRVYRCNCVSCSHLEQADGPPRLIPGGRYSIDFAVQVAADKYDTHQPLDRQVRRMGSEGLAIGSSTLWDCLEALARHLEPTYLALRDAVLGEPSIGADETTWKMLLSPKGKGLGGSKKWFAWSLAGVRPATAPPGMDRDAPFIDWRSAPAAQICITPTMKGRQLIGTAAGNFASLNPPPGPHRIYLTAGQPYRFERAQGPFEFVAADGTLDVSGRTQPGVVGESYIEPFNQPLTPALLGDTPLAPPFVPGWYYGFGVVGHFGAMVLALPDAEVGLDLRNRLGRGLHRLLLDVGISRRDHAYRIAGDDTALEPIFGVIGSRLGYAYLLHHDAWEIDAGLIGGLDWTLSRRWDTGRLLDAALHVSAVRPFDGADAWSMRVDLRAGALMLARDVIEPFVQLGFGVDFETFVGW